MGNQTGYQCLEHSNLQGGRITVPLTGLQFSKTGFDQNRLCFVICCAAVESQLLKLETMSRSFKDFTAQILFYAIF